MSQQNRLSTPRKGYGRYLHHQNNDISHIQGELSQTGSAPMDRGEGMSNNSVLSTTTDSSDAWSDYTTLTAASPMSNWEEPPFRIKGEENLYTWDENVDNAEYSPAGSQGFQTPMPGSASFTETTLEIPDSRPTPTSLKWTPHSPLLEVYKFVVEKGGKDPYFKLLDGYSVTHQTPACVFLDHPISPRKGAYPCQYPWGCQGKQKVFTRPADLERHYKNVHASSDQRDSFCCDYKKCGRSSDPFTRKDHYRDHLRDYHKEDLGCAKTQKKLGKREPSAAEQAAWLADRRIYSRWWRCARCLVRRRVSVDGWECPMCKVSCEPDRVEHRMSQAHRHRNVDLDPAEVGDEEGYQTTISATTSAATAAGFSTFYGCGTCEESPGWTENGTGGWVPCPDCTHSRAVPGCRACQESPGWTENGMGAWVPCAACTSPRSNETSSYSVSSYYN